MDQWKFDWIYRIARISSVLSNTVEFGYASVRLLKFQPAYKNVETQ